MIDKTLIEAIDKIFSIESNLENIKVGLSTKNKYCPRKIYKYRALSDNSVQNVINENIWFDNPLNMNDPYDCRFTLENFTDRKFISPEEYSSYYINYPDELDQELLHSISNRNMTYREFLQQVKIQDKPLFKLNEALDQVHQENISNLNTHISKFIFFCSFSEKFNSTLMWSHYTENHKGFCIEYDSSNNELNNPYIDLLYPIFYKEQLFDLSDYFYNKDTQVTPNKLNNLYLNYPLIHKSSEWSYEKEWRVIYNHGTLNQAKNLPTPPITSILLGCNFFRQFEHKSLNHNSRISLALRLVQNCELKKIEIKLMQQSSTCYSMDAQVISYNDCYKMLKNAE